MADTAGQKARAASSTAQNPLPAAQRPSEPWRDPDSETRSLESRQITVERLRFERDRAVATLQAFGATRGALDPLDARGLAHDLRNLLQAILGHSLRVSTLLAPDDPAQEHVRMVERAAEAAAELTERLVRPGDPDLPGRCDANAVIGELLELLQPVAPQGVVFERQLDDTLPPFAIAGDELRQIALNLLVNAWQALNERGGRIRVATHRARDRGVIEVIDDGSGVDPEVLGRMFEPFVSTRAPGRGLGLATVQLLLFRAGGDVRVSSPAGGGTSFVVGLPLAENA